MDRVITVDPSSTQPVKQGVGSYAAGNEAFIADAVEVVASIVGMALPRPSIAADHRAVRISADVQMAASSTPPGHRAAARGSATNPTSLEP
jgi:hypothetical protein